MSQGRTFTDAEILSRNVARLRNERACSRTTGLHVSAEHYLWLAGFVETNDEILAALRCFVTDERFQVAVGGNPIAVERMIATAHIALARAEACAKARGA